MAGVTVEFGAKDTGLAKSLEKVKQQLDQLNAEVKSGELSFDELQQAMRKIAQAEKVDQKLQQIAAATDNAGDKAQEAANDFDRLDREMDQVSANSPKVSTGFAGIKDSFGKVAASVAGVVAALKSMQVAFDFMKEAVMSAAALEETMNKVNVVFQEGASDIERWANNAAPSLAMTKREAADAASTFAIFGQSAGLSGDDLVGFSTRLTRLATDMASFNNSTPEEGIMAIGAALRGEAEPIRRFGVLLDDATLKNRALQMGLIDTTTQALTPQQRVLAAYNEIMAQTTIQQGDFERTSGSLTNQLKILEASIENLKAQIGEELTPSTTYWVSYVNDKAIPALEGLGIESKNAANAIAELAGEMNIGETEASVLGQTAIMLGKNVNPLGGIFDQVRMAINYFSEVGNNARDAAAEAVDGVEDLGNSATETAPELDSAASSVDALGASLLSLGGDGAGLLGGVNEGAAELNSLLGESETNLADMSGQISSQIPLITEQVGLHGELNTALGGEAEQLSSQLSLLQSQIQSEYERNAAINARKQLSLQDYETQIAINEAIASGNTELATTLKQDEEISRLTGEIAKKTGISSDEAEEMAIRLVQTKAAADEASKSSRGLAGSAAGARGEVDGIRRSMETVSQAKMEGPAKRFGERTREARAELKSLKEFIGTDISGMSLDNIIDKLGLDVGRTADSKEKLKAIEQAIKDINDADVSDVTPEVRDADARDKLDKVVKYLDGIEKPDATPEIKEQDAKTQAESVRESIVETFRDMPATIKLTADESIKAIREALAKPLEMNLTSKPGDDGGSNGLKSAVDAIKTAVQKIEQKLPMQALA